MAEIKETPIDPIAPERRAKIDKELAGHGLRIVKMTDVTVTEELLVKALIKNSGLPGNDVRRITKDMLKTLIEES